MKVTIEFDVFANQDGDMVMATDDVRFHGPESGDGLYLVFSENIMSANYHPAYRNRLIRFLRDHNVKPTPTLSHMPAMPKRHIRSRLPMPTVLINGRHWIPAAPHVPAVGE